MKKMNVIPLIMSVFLLFSCIEQEQIVLNLEEQGVAKSYQEEKNVLLSAQQVFYAATLEKIDQLENQLAELIGNKESGNKGAINEIEKTQKQIEKYKKASDYFYSMRPPRIPRPPIPPVGCLNPIANCNPIIIYTKQLVIGDDNLEVRELKVIDAKENIVGKGQIGKNEYGRTVIMEVKEFEGQATMHVDVLIENETEILLDIPVRGN